MRELGAELGLPRRHASGASRSRARAWRSAASARSRAERLDVLREADAIVEEEIRAAGLYETIWQAFAVLLPVQTVGVMGDERTYEDALALRAVHSQRRHDRRLGARCRTTCSARISTRIINEVRGINRVVYDITSQAARRRSSGSSARRFRAA